MKTALFCNGDHTQLILRPETDFEKDIMEKLTSGLWIVDVKRGEFFKDHHNYFRSDTFNAHSGKDLILVVRKPHEAKDGGA